MFHSPVAAARVTCGTWSAALTAFRRYIRRAMKPGCVFVYGSCEILAFMVPPARVASKGAGCTAASFSFVSGRRSSPATDIDSDLRRRSAAERM